MCLNQRKDKILFHFLCYSRKIFLPGTIKIKLSVLSNSLVDHGSLHSKKMF